MRLWHYTCEHGSRGINAERCIRPGIGGYVWLTDLPPSTRRLRKALGLTSHTLACDRMAHAFTVDVEDPIPFKVLDLSPNMVRGLVLPGARPANWYVTRERILL